MRKIKCLIVDDEELARLLLENYAARIPFLEVVDKCAHPLEAMEAMRREAVELLFLDIQMPELNGLAFLKSLSQKPMVVLTTAYSEYALEGYDLDVVDYLLKPIAFERFLQAVHKAEERLPAAAAAPDRKVILVKSEHKIHRLPLDEIHYIQSMREYIAYHTPEGRLLALGSLKQLEEVLPSDRFVRIHKSYMVAVDFIRSVEGNLVHLSQISLPVGAGYREGLLERLK